ncbi:hypothetical protein AKJ09_05291 [Labilithrix luteola]|uniref:SURF1-like protein n=1 Tax=Labilithrix luteola TaxID=1391654 RepID=A0A0K1PYQ0_9BACT|nr:hypothetical protein [Labilithrix luteola]AKU98627.1 hypothetical protein AKJ09_05291 [Labilithrix luteola]
MTDAPSQPLDAPRGGPRETQREELDPELLELPDPPKRERTLTVVMLVVTAIASIAMIFALRRDAAYAFTDAHPADLGDLIQTPEGAFQENRFVRGQGMLGAAAAIRYERPLTEGSFRLMPVAGRPNVWVEVRVPAGAENVRYVPPSQFTGRLVRFETGGPKHRGLAAAVKDATGQDIPQGSWLLVEGDAPQSSRWALLLVALFAGFAVWNVAVMAKLLRRVPEA